MSGIIFLAPLLSAIVCVVLWKVLRQIALVRSWPKLAMRSLLLSVVVAFPIICSGITAYLPAALRREAVNASSTEANRLLVFMKLPESATDVTCLHDTFAGLTEAAVFSIAENAFLEWAATNLWQPEKFDSPGEVDLDWRCIRLGIPNAEGEDSLNVTWFTSVFPESSHPPVSRGYYCDTYDKEGSDDSGIAVLYDSKNKRCYVTFTTY